MAISVGNVIASSQVQLAPSAPAAQPAVSSSAPSIGPAATVELSSAAIHKCCGK